MPEPHRSALGQLTLARVRLFVREPEAVFWVIVFPLILTMILGFAFRQRRPADEPVAVLAAPGERAAAEALARHLEGGTLLHVEILEDRAEAERKLRFGHVAALLEPGEPPRLVADPERPEAELARLRVERALARANEHGPVIELHEVQETGSRYIDWLFPGILGMNLMGTGIWGIGFAIADMRQKKLIRRFLVTPMRKSSLLLSFLGSRMVFLAIELAVLGTFGFLVLRVPLRGSFLAFCLFALAGMLSFAAIGLLAVCRARTIEGASGLMNLIVMPMWLVSGVFFSYERFPEALHPLLRALPLTALNDALRATALEGRTVVSLTPELGVLVAWGVIAFAVAVRLFRWE